MILGGDGRRGGKVHSGRSWVRVFRQMLYSGASGVTPASSCRTAGLVMTKRGWRGIGPCLATHAASHAALACRRWASAAGASSWLRSPRTGRHGVGDSTMISVLPGLSPLPPLEPTSAKATAFQVQPPTMRRAIVRTGKVTCETVAISQAALEERNKSNDQCIEKQNTHRAVK